MGHLKVVVMCAYNVLCSFSIEVFIMSFNVVCKFERGNREGNFFTVAKADMRLLAAPWFPYWSVAAA